MPLLVYRLIDEMMKRRHED